MLRSPLGTLANRPPNRYAFDGILSGLGSTKPYALADLGYALWYTLWQEFYIALF